MIDQRVDLNSKITKPEISFVSSLEINKSFYCIDWKLKGKILTFSYPNGNFYQKAVLVEPKY